MNYATGVYADKTEDSVFETEIAFECFRREESWLPLCVISYRCLRTKWSSLRAPFIP